MKNLSLLIKPASSGCNMRCRYCFYADIVNTRGVKNYGIMSFETLEILVRKALSEATEYCAFGFQGGEPTLVGLDFFQGFIALEKKYNINKVRVSHALQTNGLLLDKTWVDFFKNNKFLIGLSIDASKQIHNSLRLDSSGKGTHSRCLKAASLLAERGVDFNILSVVTNWLAAHPDNVYRFYKQNGFRHIQFIPCIDEIDDAHGTNEYSLSTKKYGDFLCRIFDLWYDDFIKDDYFSIRTFDNYIYMLAGFPAENCAMNGICTAHALVEADGGVYPCDFYAFDNYLLGNIASHNFNTMLSGEKAESFRSPSHYADTDCQVCNYYFICRGGCRRDREPLSEGQLSLNHYCKAYKAFFSHALSRMQNIAMVTGRRYHAI